jgi:hypothetical protein
MNMCIHGSMLCSNHNTPVLEKGAAAGMAATEVTPVTNAGAMDMEVPRTWRDPNLQSQAHYPQHQQE